jgi:hypothetical protein
MDDDKNRISLTDFFGNQPIALPVLYRRSPLSVTSRFDYRGYRCLKGEQAQPFIQQLRLKPNTKDNVIKSLPNDFVVELKDANDHTLISAHIPRFSRDIMLFSDGTIICFDRCYTENKYTQTVFSTDGTVEVLITGWSLKNEFSDEYASRSVLQRGAQSMFKQWLDLERIVNNLTIKLLKPLEP